MKSFKRQLFEEHRRVYDDLASDMLDKIIISTHEIAVKYLTDNSLDLLRTA